MTGPPRAARRWIGRAALGTVVVAGYAVIVAPLVFVSWLAFFRNEVASFPPEGYSLRWFANILDQKNFVDGFLTSLEIALVAMVNGLVVGVPAALALARHRLVGREAAATLLLLPLVVPGVVAGAAIYVFHVEVEVATGIRRVAALPGLVLAHVMITIPWTVRLIAANLSGLDRSVEEAAMNLGAGPVLTFRRIMLPMIPPGIVAAALFSFIVSFGNLEMTLFLVGPGRITLPIAILQYLEWRIDPTIAAVSFRQIVLVGAGMILTDRCGKLANVF